LNILTVNNVSKKYATHLALNDVSLTVPRESIYGLLGPNGAGKTSLIRIITQITGPDSGTILFNDKPLKAEHIGQIGYLPEERGLYKKMEVGEQLIYFARLKGLSRNDALIRLKDWIERFGMQDWWRKKIEELSKGMQQKVQFISTVLHQPELIILDEPFSGFDPINANLITDEILRLKANGCSIIFSTHRMESVEQLCDHIALINKTKKIVEGPIHEIRNQYKDHTFTVRHTTPLVDSNFFKILSTKTVYGSIVSNIVVQNDASNNAVLKQLISQSDISRFEENIPGMQDVFMRAVNGNQADNNNL
jgi:ABC-2 type transport system ATP-binding protein